MQIDWWTLALQTINLLVLIWILARFFFRPIAKIIEQRQAEANAITAQADAARKDADSARAALDKDRAELAGQREHILDAARKDAAAESANLKALATQEMERRRSEAEAELAREGAAADEAMLARASDLAIDIARRLLTRAPAELAFSAFLDGLRGKLDVLKEAPRIGVSLEVVTAAALTNDEKEKVRRLLREELDIDANPLFRVDQGVIAGIELHGRHAVIKNSWRADLDSIRSELSDVEHRR